MKRSTLLMILSVILAIIGFAIPAHADDAPKLQAIINAAHGVANLAGTWDIETPVYVPQGTKNLTISGGSFSSKTLPPKEYFQVGPSNLGSGSQWPMAQNGVAVGDLTAGQTRIPVKGTWKTGQYVEVWDNTKIYSSADGANTYSRHELFKVAGYLGGVLVLDKPLGREFSAAYVSDVTPYVCVNISFVGMTFDGIGSTYAGNFISFALCDGITLTNCKGQHFTNSGRLGVYSRGIRESGCDFEISQQPTLGGYADYDEGDDDVIVKNNKTGGCQHGEEFKGGGIGAQYINCTSTSGFDSHGEDDRNLLYNGCTGQFGCANGSKEGGDGPIICSDDDFSGQPSTDFNPGAHDVLLTNCKLSQVWMPSTWRDGKVAAPTRITMNGGSVVAPFQLLRDDPCGGAWAFNEVSFESTNLPWGSIFQWTGEVGGEYTFTNCTFSMLTTVSDVPFQLTSGSPTIVFNGGSITCKGKPLETILKGAGFTGSVVVNGTTGATVK